MLVKSSEITLSGWANYVIYYMNRKLNDVITRSPRVINTSMNFWKELLINGVYIAAVLALLYILTYTDMVSHLLASWSTLQIEAEIRLEYYSIVPHP